MTEDEITEGERMTPTPPASGQDAASEVEAALWHASYWHWGQCSIDISDPSSLSHSTKIGLFRQLVDPHLEPEDAKAIVDAHNTEVSIIRAALRASAEQVRVLTGEVATLERIASWNQLHHREALANLATLQARAEKAEAALRAIKHAALVADSVGALTVPHAFARIVRLCIDAGIVEKLNELKALAAKAEADHG